jgi:hypothetical protein
MISGIAAYKDSYLVLAYLAPDTFDNEATDDPVEQRRKAANRPELRLINKGEEISSDALSLTNYHLYGCNDYVLAPSKRDGEDLFFVVSPKDVVVARPRDAADHVSWLVDQQRYAEALDAAEKLKDQHGHVLDVKAIGIKYIKHLFEQGKLAFQNRLTSRFIQGSCRSDAQGLGSRQQDVGRLDLLICSERSITGTIHVTITALTPETMIPFIPQRNPQLSGLVYEMVLAHLLVNDRPVCCCVLAPH